MSAFSIGATALGSLPIPPADPLGYPVPLELLRGLSYLTLTLHLLAMYFTLGGVALWLYLRLRKPAHGESMSAFLGGGLTLGFSYLVTLGIPPLLFVQVMYGQLFYSSSVIVGAHWILVVPLLIVAYGLFYLHKLTRRKSPGPQWVYLLIGFLAMLTIGFFYVNNLTLMQTPERWMAIYQERPNGLALNMGEPTVVSRLLMFLSPALAVSGLGLLLAGAFLRRWEQEEKGRAFQGFGLRAFLAGIVLAVAFGAWFLVTVPQPVMAAVREMGWVLPVGMAGVGLFVVAAVLVIVSTRVLCYWTPIIAIVVSALAVAAVVVVRDMVRVAYLQPVFSASEVPVHAQWVMFILFAITLVLGLALVIGLTSVVVRNVVRGYREGDA
jgi:hypothetical protein